MRDLVFLQVAHPEDAAGQDRPHLRLTELAVVQVSLVYFVLEGSKRAAKESV